MSASEAPRAGAFFDLDRTLVEGSSGIHFVRAAYEAGFVSRRQLLRDVWTNVMFRLNGATDAQADAVRERVGEMIRDVPVRDFERLSHRVLAGVLPKVYTEMLQIAHDHQDRGRRIYICTAASQEMAEMMAHILGFDGAVGSRSEIVDGRYTGRPGGPFAYGEGKAQLMRQIAAEDEIDLAESYAYSDSVSDLPMLRLVGNPVCVNPDAELESVAAQEAWPVIRVDRLKRKLRRQAAFAGALAVGGAAVAVGRAAGGSVNREPAGRTLRVPRVTGSAAPTRRRR